MVQWVEFASTVGNETVQIQVDHFKKLTELVLSAVGKVSYSLDAGRERGGALHTNVMT